MKRWKNHDVPMAHSTGKSNQRLVALWSRHSRYLLVTSGISGLFGCSPSPVALADPMIHGGREVGASSTLPTRRSTLAITDEKILAQGHSFCTAVLIGPKTALTAAHCVTDADGQPLDPKTFLIANGNDLTTSKSAPVKVVATAVHRRWRPGALDSGEWTDFNDLAMLELESTPPASRPVNLVNPEVPPQKGDRLTLAGYGVTSTRSVDDTGILRSVLVRVAAVEEDIHILMTEGAKRPGVALDPSDEEGKMRLNRVHAGACAGDSGGPAYRKSSDGKSWELVGITSFGTETERVDGTPGERHCNGSNGYTNLTPYVESLKLSMNALSETNFCPGATFEFDEEGLKPLTSGECVTSMPNS